MEEMIIITYDLETGHIPVKDGMKSLGYTDTFSQFKFDGGSLVTEVCYLPNTTLYHASKTKQQALDDLESECRKIQIKPERAVAMEVVKANVKAIKGKPFGSTLYDAFRRLKRY